MHREAFRHCLQGKYNPRETKLMLKQKTILTNKHHAVKRKFDLIMHIRNDHAHRYHF